ncbi:hypothetical protein BDY17DRAFT_356881 [Neohortaea acidophila]|uniref:ASX DEUBAD domain-containing protein n=1 Tax=Neohortaea acidophila TaxID=245834 RepID=A0A6A6PFT2_9PEZI|nr:uncharacterized protein BDY17DRAFT_356881 [Neohortaea acidophila]KAF2478830.1 hypothetical protein BDY17DRAFT_356881 [Neohortaea acidophila]
MSSTQTRLLTAPTSKLTKQNLVAILRKDAAWLTLPPETRAHLYALLPAPREGEPPHDADVHPLHNTAYKPYIEEALRRFGADLREGREVGKWRVEAMVAGRERREGKFEEWREVLREEYWGRRGEGEESGKGEGEVNGHGDGDEAKVEIKDSEGDE